jgi:hypothetical protein
LPLRIRDLDLAEMLERTNPAQIREQIENNRGELQRHAIIRSERGHPGVEYWLNFKQAIAAPRAS